MVARIKWPVETVAMSITHNTQKPLLMCNQWLMCYMPPFRKYVPFLYSNEWVFCILANTLQDSREKLKGLDDFWINKSKRIKSWDIIDTECVRMVALSLKHSSCFTTPPYCFPEASRTKEATDMPLPIYDIFRELFIKKVLQHSQLFMSRTLRYVLE
jgi:hypothetical protein